MASMKTEDNFWTSDNGSISVGLTHSQLNITEATSAVRSPKAGAIVLFAVRRHLKDKICWVCLEISHGDFWSFVSCTACKAVKMVTAAITVGTTRDNFQGKPVQELQYTSYVPRALETMTAICKDIHAKHELVKMYMVHRLGVVPIGEESILICVSAPHRQAAWEAGEEALERCKEKVEVWKLEEFGGDEAGIWRANRDGPSG